MNALLVGNPGGVWEPPVGVYEVPRYSTGGAQSRVSQAPTVLQVDTEALTSPARSFYLDELAVVFLRELHRNIATHGEPTFWRFFGTRRRMSCWHEATIDDDTTSLPRAALEEMLVASDYLNPTQHPDVEFVGERLVERLNSTGHGAKVRTVLQGVRQYFAGVPVSVEWPEESPFGRPVTIRVRARSDLDMALETLERFDNEWWFQQDFELHRLIGVHLA